MGKSGRKERWAGNRGKNGKAALLELLLCKVFANLLGAELWFAELRPPQNRVLLLRATLGSTRFSGGFRTF